MKIMDLICRTCLKMSGTHFNIFEYSTNTRLITDLIMELTSIKILKGDGLSVNICDNCLDKLNLACEFKQMIIESDQELTQLQQSKELQNNTSAEIGIKEETASVESEQVEYTFCLSSNDENTGEDIVYNSVNEENMSEKADPLNDRDCTTSVLIESKFQETSPVCKVGDEHPIDLYKSDNLEDRLPTSTNSDICPKNKISSKSYSVSREELLIDNPDYRRIMGSGLTRDQKNRATVYCNLCNRTLSFRYYIGTHVYLHTGHLPFKCDQCDVRFAKKYLLAKHMYMHSEKKEYACEECGKAFAFAHQLTVHKVNHSEERPYNCNVCGKGFKLPRFLKEHQVYHKKNKQFICEECGKAYFRKRDLNNHQSTHSAVKGLACKICGKLFRHKTALGAHAKLHSANPVAKPYSCNMCDKKFSRKKLLDEHSLVHTGIKSHTCKVCERKFRLSRALQRHMRIHVADMSYPCKLCMETFNDTNLLENHMKTHDNDIKQEVENSEELKDS